MGKSKTFLSAILVVVLSLTIFMPFTKSDAFAESADIQFNEPQVYLSADYTGYGNGYTDTIVADFNQDGIHDFAAICFDDYGNGDKLYIYLGAGDGNFIQYADYATGATPLFMCSSDINHDSVPDLLVTCNWSYGFQVFIGNGDGSFLDPVLYTINGYAGSIDVADINQDGHLDAVVANINQSTVNIFWGAGDGSFSSEYMAVQTGYHPQTVKCGDLNNDSLPDIVVTNVYSSAVSVLISVDAGSYLPYQLVPTGAHPCNLVIGDVNYDGKNDIITANEDSHSISVLLGIGDGSFDIYVDYVAGTGAHDIEFADLNGDEYQDLVVSNLYGNTVSTYYGHPDGSFEMINNNIFVNIHGSAVGCADFNNDGLSDIIVASCCDVSVFIQKKIVSILFNEPQVYLSADYTGYGNGYTDTIVADFNQDGIHDFAAICFDDYGSGDKLYIYLGAGDGSFTQYADYATGATPLFMCSYDINHDNVLDLLVTCNWSYGFQVFIGNGDGSFLDPVLYTIDGFPGSIDVADIDQDGHLDAVVANISQSTVNIFWGVGDGSFYSEYMVFQTGYHPQTVKCGDLNNDTLPDIVVTNVYSSAVSVLIAADAGSYPTYQHVPTGAHPCNLVIGDVNYDGKNDIITANEDSHSISVLLGIGDGSFGSYVDYAAGTGAHDIEFADLNGDEYLDLVVSNYYGNTVSTYYGLPDGSFEMINNNIVVNIHGSAVVCADFNNDGLSDIIVASCCNVSVFIQQFIFDSYAAPILSYPDTGGYYGWLSPVLFNKKVKYHIATDHKADIGTEVRSILGNGIVVYAKQNTSAYGSLSPDSPGGAVVIQYANKNGDPFYVLYGHITIDNAILAAYKSKSTIYIEKGQIVGTISSFYNAGELLPHLHFAISTSLDLKLILSGYVDDLSKVGDMVYPYDYLEEYCK